MKLQTFQLIWISLLCAQSMVAQRVCPPAMQWQRLLGGNKPDYFSSVHETHDGGFILGGTSASGRSKSKHSPNFGSNDFWVVKLDAEGRKEWERSFGGSDDEFLSVLRVTRDGGFILGGSSASKTDGNKTSPNFGGSDFWVIRLDSAGKKIWERSFGGSGDDRLSDLQQTGDGGFIVGGSSASAPSGNKMSVNLGAWDFWVVRVDAHGNKLWENTFGGTELSFLWSLEQTSDGGFILGGQRQGDYWLVRLDQAGLHMWDRSVGGSGFDFLNKVKETRGGGFILGGYSDSGADGDKTSPATGRSSAWIVRLDENANKLWDVGLGETDRFYSANSLHETPDGSFIVAGYSLITLPFTNSDIVVTLTADVHSWIAKLDFRGHLTWKLPVGNTNGNNALSSLEPTSDGGFVLCGGSDSASVRTNTIAFYESLNGWVMRLRPDDDCDGDGVSHFRDHRHRSTRWNRQEWLRH